MALVKCDECGNSVSTQAATCPHCGAPQQPDLPVLVADVPSPIRKKPNRQEETIHSDDNVSVTTTRVIIRGTTYALRNITSVRMAFTPPKSGCAFILLILGIVCSLFPVLELFKNGAHVLVVFHLMISGAMIGGAILWLRSLKYDYHVAVSSASGEANVLSSKDEMYVERIVNSINEAIVKYQ